MFHEMGHAVHGLFSDVHYPSQAGTSVPRDFVEFPSTFQEDWAIHPEVLANYAIHYQTGEPIPQELLDKLIEARHFNQGFDTQRSEEHTSELQSRGQLVCRLLLEKKK